MSNKIQILYDTSADVPDTGAQYFQCARCMFEIPDGAAPVDWARQQLSILQDGRLQLRCTRHSLNIATMDFKAVETGKEEALQQIQNEYDRCIHLQQHPEEAPALYNTEGREYVVRHYSRKAEGLGFALDRLSRAGKRV